MKADTCLIARITRLYLCVKPSFPSLSEVFTTASRCGDMTNKCMSTSELEGLSQLYILSSEKCGTCSEGVRSPRGNAGENGQVCSVSLFPCGLSRVEVL